MNKIHFLRLLAATLCFGDASLAFARNDSKDQDSKVLSSGSNFTRDGSQTNTKATNITSATNSTNSTNTSAQSNTNTNTSSGTTVLASQNTSTLNSNNINTSSNLQASVEAVSMGTLMVAEGLKKVSSNSNDDEALPGVVLVHTGLKLMRLGAGMKPSSSNESENALEADQRILASGEGKQILSETSKELGVSEKELLEKILKSRGYPSGLLEAFSKTISAGMLSEAHGVADAEKEAMVGKAKVGKLSSDLKSVKALKAKIAALAAQKAKLLAANKKLREESGDQGFVAESAKDSAVNEANPKFSDMPESLSRDIASDKSMLSLNGDPGEFFGELATGEDGTTLFDMVAKKYAMLRVSFGQGSAKKNQK